MRDLSETAVVLDLACYRLIEDPDDAIEPGGWGVDNIDPDVWIVPVIDWVPVTCQPTDCPQPYIAYADWMQRTSGFLSANPEATEWIEGHDYGVMIWLYVNGGSVTEIVEPDLVG